MPGPSPTDGAYIRGGGGANVGHRRVGGIVLAVCAVVLAVTAIVLTISTSHQNANADLLRRHGVPVEATVTGCVGISSGVGMGIVYWQCRGSYALGGGTFTAVLAGNRSLLDAGQKIQAVAVPGHPSLLSTSAAVSDGESGRSSYAAPVALAAVAAAIVGVLLVWRRRASP